MDPGVVRQRAEKVFKLEERERAGRAAMSEYEARGQAIRANMVRLKALRLAKEKEASSAVREER